MLLYKIVYTKCVNTQTHQIYFKAAGDLTVYNAELVISLFFTYVFITGSSTILRLLQEMYETTLFRTQALYPFTLYSSFKLCFVL